MNEAPSERFASRSKNSFRPSPVRLSGTPFAAESIAVRVGNLSIADYVELPIEDAVASFDKIKLSEREAQIAGLVLREIKDRLRFLAKVGLGYLTLDRASATLSGGEGQRIRLATQIGSQLRGVLYVLDEPSIGLHPRDNQNYWRRSPPCVT
jgi:excinuclease ABC subunit A